MSTMPRDERGHMRQFLDPKSKVNLSFTNKKMLNESKTDQDIHCWKETNELTACSGMFQNMKIAGECLTFCKHHVNSVMAKFINIMFSGNITAINLDGTQITRIYPILVTIQTAPEDEMKPMEVLFEFQNDNVRLRLEETIGDWAIRNFDFQSSEWEMMVFTFDTEFIPNDVFFDTKWILKWDREYDAIVVYNQSFTHTNVEMDEPD
jgi:hypothetical protein